MATSTLSEGVLKRDRIVIGAGLVGLTGISWVYLVHLNRSMDMAMMDMSGMTMPMMLPWRVSDFVYTFLMWAVMMVGMMVPSAAPMVLTFATVNRRRAAIGGPFVPTGIFLLGYLAIWTLFSFLATLAQWRLHAAAVLDAHSQTVAPWVGSVLLIAAGIFQLTPAKTACLRHCRSPLDFLTIKWREGYVGAFRMGVEHGFYCVGCCWLLMALLFVAGVMNLIWVAMIAAFVLAEKLLPRGRSVSLAGSGALLVAGVVWLTRSAGWLKLHGG